MSDVPIHDAMAISRMMGYDWSTVNGYHHEFTANMQAAGYEPADVNEYLGRPAPNPAQDSLRTSLMRRDAAEPELFNHDAEEPPDILNGQLRSEYARAMTDGTTKGPADFANGLASFLTARNGDPETGDVHPEVQAHAEAMAGTLASKLPTEQDITDMSIALAAQFGTEVPTPSEIRQARGALLERWAATGDPIADVFRRLSTEPLLAALPMAAPVSVPGVPALIDGLRNVANQARGRAEEVYNAPLAGGRDEWGIHTPADQEGVVGWGKTLAYIVAKDVDAIARLPAAVVMGLVGGAEGILQSATGDKQADLARLIRDVIQPGMVMAGGEIRAPSLKLPPVDVVDPVKPPGAAVTRRPAVEAYTQPHGIEQLMERTGPIERLPAPQEGVGAFQRALETAPPIISNETEAAAAKAAVTEQQIQTVAKGFDVASAVWTHLTELARDTSGALDLGKVGRDLADVFRTPEQRALRDETDAAAGLARSVIRQYRGVSDRVVSAHYNMLEEFRRPLNEHMPEYLSWLQDMRGWSRYAQAGGTAVPMPAKPVLQHFLDYVEGRSVGATIDPMSPLRPVADAMRNVALDLRDRIQDTLPDMDSFYDDYYRHMWTDPVAADRVFGRRLAREGSGSSLKLREIPTLSEGIERGLIPAIPDPIENTMHYVSSMMNFLANKKMLGEFIDTATAKWGTRLPEAGWQELKGAAAQRLRPFIDPDTGQPRVMAERLYAQPGAARIWNNYLGRGIFDWPQPLPQIYKGIQYASNMMTAAKLAWFGFHAAHIVQEAAVAKVTAALGELPRGEVFQGLRDMGYGLTTFPALVDLARKGHEFQQKYLNLDSTDPVTDLLTEAGIRPLGRSSRYQGVSTFELNPLARGENIMTLLRRGQLTMALQEEARGILGHPEKENLPARLLMTGPRAAGFFVDQIMRVMDTINAPMFDTLIPKVKAGAAVEELEGWLRRNPAAGRDEARAMARQIIDSMDDRFGELNQDNLFWPRAVKQILNAATVSIGWEFGTLRAMGRGAWDVMRLDLNSTRARWMIGFPMMVAFVNSLYQYAHTGQFPWQGDDPLRDLVLPRTGGTFHDLRGRPAPERALLPGYIKDWLQTYRTFKSTPDFMHLPGGLAEQTEAKLNPFWQTMMATVKGQDPIGHHIFEAPNPPFQNWGLPPAFANWLKFVGGQLTPIVAEQLGQRPPGSEVPWYEKMLGARPAGSFFQNEAQALKGQQRHEKTIQQQERTREHREQRQQQQGTAPTPTREPSLSPAPAREPFLPSAPVVPPDIGR